jgi:microcystin-dependent protein
VFQTGDVIWLDGPTFRAGWVRDNGKTISNTGNGGTERSALDCHALFLFLWNTYSDQICPVVGGRGPNAESDWGSRQITLPDKRGYSPVGDTAMGNADTARLAGVPFSQGNATTPGSQGGEAIHTLTTTEMPLHAHAASISGSHNHGINIVSGGGIAGSQTGTAVPGVGTSSIDPSAIRQSADGAGLTVSIGNNGGNGAHNNTPYVVIGSFFRKL